MSTPRGSSRFRLTHRLLIALLGFAAVLAVVLVGLVGPRTEDAFRRHGTDLIEQGSRAMRDLAGEQTRATGRVLVDLIEHGARARQRTLRDLPLELLGGDVAGIRAAIEAEDARRSVQQQRNVEALALEMQARAERSIESRFDDLVATQERRTAIAADELRTTHLVLVGSAFGILLLGLGLGLDRLVVRPTRALREATQRIADGQLDTDLPRHSRTELGDLARDFAAMVEQLRSSRRELQRLNENLEHDVAEKTAELRSSHQKLAEAERLAALGTLAGGIAHEFHNVIGGIRGCTDELMADEGDAERRETMQVILRAADRATSIVQQLRRFARHSVDARAEIDARAVAEDALRLCEPAARRQGIAVERAFAPSPPLWADADGLHQVLVNLLLNAVQAMPDGGRLRVAIEPRGDGVAISVADTGCGIAEDDLEHVFEPFFTTRKDEPSGAGTGLGLSVSWGIVAAHGGQILVDSKPGEGATFTVVLPQCAS